MPKQASGAIFLLVLIFSILNSSGWSQVPVEKSKDKVVIAGKAYYIHVVKKGETAYSISRVYGISTEELIKENPSAVYGIEEKQSLKIPVVENSEIKKTPEPVLKRAARDEGKYIYHKLNRGETVYFLSRKYGVSEDDIVQSNPGVDINKMSVGFEIAIPKREFMKNIQKFEVRDTSFSYHKVVKGETLNSIGEKYGVTARELRRENRGLLFPRVGDFIKIPSAQAAKATIVVKSKPDTLKVVPEPPVTEAVKAEGFTMIGNLKGTFNVALLLPLYIAENSERREIDSSGVVKGKHIYETIIRPDEWIYPPSIPFLELYEGVLIAADTLRTHGVDINLYVYDIKSDTIGITQLIESGELKNMDLIIGPVYSKNLSIVAKYAESYEIPVISPVDLRSNSSLDNHPFLFMANPSLGVAQEMIATRAGKYYNDNIVFIHSDTTHADPDVYSFKSKIFKELSLKMPYEDIKFKEFIFYSRSAFNNDSINRLEHALSESVENLILIASEEPPVMSESIMNVHALLKKFPVRLIGYPAMRGLDNLDPKYFFDLGIELYSPYWIDYQKKNVINFDASFRQKFLTEPSPTSFAWQGYDIAYYFISGLALNGKKFVLHPEIHNPELLETSFDFTRTGEGNGFENQKLYLIKYTPEMDIELVEENDIDSSTSVK